MTVAAQPTPNPNACKFTVGRPVGGPASYTDAATAEHPAAAELLAVEGVTSVFLTSDFFTVSKTDEADWAAIIPQARSILETRYPD